MAYVPDIRRPGYGAAWQTKKADREYPFTTTDGTEYILYVPSSQQFNAYNKSFKEHKDVFDQIKADVKDDATIAKNGDGLPSNWDHYEWAASLSSTLKNLNKTWGVNDKIWIRNKNDDGSKSTVAVVAIKPVKTQRNAKRTAKKISAATEPAAATGATDDDGYIDVDDIEFGPMLAPITQVVFVKTINGLTYYYYTREDADNNKYFKIENSDDELVNESGKRINPDGTLMKFIRKSDFDKRQERKRSKRDWAEKAIETRNDVWLDDYDTSPEPSEGFITEDEEGDEDEEEAEEEAEEEVEDRDTALARMAEEDARIAEEEARIAEEHARIAEEEASIANEHARIAESDRIAEAARIAADPRLVEASIDLPPGWKAYISTKYDEVFFYKPPPPGHKGNGTTVWKRPEAGGKRTKKRLRRRSTSKQMKKKRTTTRRKMTTTRRK